MSRTYAIERTVYSFDELSDQAKETAREEWSRFLWEAGGMHESLTLLFDGFMGERGWQGAELRTYSLYSQGGYPTFRGTLPAFEHDGRTYVVTVTTRHGGGGAEHMVTDVEDVEDTDAADYGSPEWPAYLARIQAAGHAAEEMVSDLSSELYQAFAAEDDYQSSEEAVREAAEANGYEYDEDGTSTSKIQLLVDGNPNLLLSRRQAHEVVSLLAKALDIQLVKADWVDVVREAHAEEETYYFETTGTNDDGVDLVTVFLTRTAEMVACDVPIDRAQRDYPQEV